MNSSTVILQFIKIESGIGSDKNRDRTFNAWLHWKQDDLLRGCLLSNTYCLSTQPLPQLRLLSLLPQRYGPLAGAVVYIAYSMNCNHIRFRRHYVVLNHIIQFSFHRVTTPNDVVIPTSFHRLLCLHSEIVIFRFHVRHLDFRQNDKICFVGDSTFEKLLARAKNRGWHQNVPIMSTSWDRGGGVQPQVLHVTNSIWLYEGVTVVNFSKRKCQCVGTFRKRTNEWQVLHRCCLIDIIDFIVTTCFRFTYWTIRG